MAIVEMQALKKIGTFAHVQYLFLNGSKVVAEVSMASVNFPLIHKTVRMKLCGSNNITDYRSVFSTDEDKRLNRDIMDGDWIFSQRGVNPEILENKLKQMHAEISFERNSKIAVADQNQGDFLKKCGFHVSVFLNLPQTIDLIFTKTIYEPPMRKHTCRTKRIYCSQTEAWIKARYTQSLLKPKRK